jgi:hypothetical protein
MAVLTVFAEGRFRATKAAVRAKRPWPGSWVADVNAAYAVLLRHPMATDAQVVWHHDFLTWLGATDRAGRVLDEGIGRFPDSAALHGLMRARLLKDKGAEALETYYEAKLQGKDAPPGLERFAGAASMLVSETARQARDAKKAAEAYDRAVGHWERAAQEEPLRRDEADDRVAIARAGQARLAFEADDDEAALTQILASFERRPGSAGTLDGLGLTPASTAQALLARLKERSKDDLAAKLEAAMGKLDPALLVPKNE